MISKYSILFALIALFSLAAVHAEDEEQYTSKYDNIDVDAILANDKLRNQYLHCIMETGPCVTADAKYLKEKFAEAFATKCQKCTARQIESLDKVTSWYMEHEPDTWHLVIEKALEDLKRKGN